MNSWWEKLDDRQKKEIKFSLMYEDQYNHGTDGHNRLLLIAKLVHLLEEQDMKIKELLEGKNVK